MNLLFVWYSMKTVWFSKWAHCTRIGINSRTFWFCSITFLYLIAMCLKIWSKWLVKYNFHSNKTLHPLSYLHPTWGPRSIRLSVFDLVLYWIFLLPDELEEVVLTLSEIITGGGDVCRNEEDFGFGVEVLISSFQLFDFGIETKVEDPEELARWRLVWLL